MQDSSYSNRLSKPLCGIDDIEKEITIDESRFESIEVVDAYTTSWGLKILNLMQY